MMMPGPGWHPRRCTPCPAMTPTGCARCTRSTAPCRQPMTATRMTPRSSRCGGPAQPWWTARRRRDGQTEDEDMKFVHMLMWAALAAAPVSIATAAPAADADAPSPAAAVSMLESGLGIVADGRDRTGDGVLVRAVLPGGAAERLGVRPGDRLVSVNGESLADAAAPHALLDRLIDGSGGEVRLELLRDGQALALAGHMNVPQEGPAAAVAPVEGCGWVST